MAIFGFEHFYFKHYYLCKYVNLDSYTLNPSDKKWTAQIYNSTSTLSFLASPQFPSASSSSFAYTLASGDELTKAITAFLIGNWWV